MSVYFCILATCILRYILLLDILIDIMFCFYSLFNQPSLHQVEDIVDSILNQNSDSPVLHIKIFA